MSDTAYPPIPVHVHTIACAIVKTKRKEDSPVIIRIEDMDSLPRSASPGEPAAYTVHAVTFEATYRAHDEWSHATGSKHTFQTFAGWTCLNAVAPGPGGVKNA